MFKVIITDLDRTLLHTDKTISPYTLQVLKHCKEKGILLMAATARPLRAIEEYRKQLAFDALTVMNGAQVICGEHVECFGMSRESAGKVLEGLCVREGKGRSVGARMPECCGCVESAVAETVDKKPIPFSLEMGNEVYSNVPIPDWESVIYKDFPRLPEGEALYKIIVTL